MARKSDPSLPQDYQAAARYWYDRAERLAEENAQLRAALKRKEAIVKLPHARTSRLPDCPPPNL
jgi:hypothetical protein